MTEGLQRMSGYEVNKHRQAFIEQGRRAFHYVDPIGLGIRPTLEASWLDIAHATKVLHRAQPFSFLSHTHENLQESSFRTHDQYTIKSLEVILFGSVHPALRFPEHPPVLALCPIGINLSSAPSVPHP